MNDVFKINTKIKPLVKIPDYTFIDYHNLQPSICYYARKYDDKNNYDLIEAKIERTQNKVKDRYTLGAGTSIKVIDTFMYSYLKHKNDDLDYDKFIKTTLEENDMTTEFFKEKYRDGSIPTAFKATTKYHNIIDKGFQVLYVARNSKDKKIEQIYIVFVKETKEKLIDTDVHYITFKPVQLITSLDYLKHAKGNRYNVFEYPDINIPASILK